MQVFKGILFYQKIVLGIRFKNNICCIPSALLSGFRECHSKEGEGEVHVPFCISYIIGVPSASARHFCSRLYQFYRSVNEKTVRCAVLRTPRLTQAFDDVR